MAPAGTAAPRSNIAGYKQVSNYTPEQMQLFQNLIGKLNGGNGLGGGVDFLSKLAGGDEAAFAQSETPAYRAFDKQIGQLGSRFAGFGSGALDSSAFQNATSGAAGELAENLQSKRMGLQQSALDRLLGLSSSLLGQQPYSLQEEDQGFDWGGLLGMLGGSLLGPFGGGIGKGIGKAAGNKWF